MSALLFTGLVQGSELQKPKESLKPSGSCPGFSASEMKGLDDNSTRNHNDNTNSHSSNSHGLGPHCLAANTLRTFKNRSAQLQTRGKEL